MKTYSLFEALELSKTTGMAIECLDLSKQLPKLKIDSGVFYTQHRLGSDTEWRRENSLPQKYLDQGLVFKLVDAPKEWVFVTTLIGIDSMPGNHPNFIEGSIFSFEGKYDRPVFEGRQVEVRIKLVE